MALSLMLFILRPAWPARLHAALFRDPTFDVGSPIHRSMDTGDLAGATGAIADRAWVEQRYGNPREPAKVRAMEDERFFAIRQFELTDGKRVIVLSEVGATPPAEMPTALAAVRDF